MVGRGWTMEPSKEESNDGPSPPVTRRSVAHLRERGGILRKRYRHLIVFLCPKRTALCRSDLVIHAHQTKNGIRYTGRAKNSGPGSGFIIRHIERYRDEMG